MIQDGVMDDKQHGFCDYEKTSSKKCPKEEKLLAEIGLVLHCHLWLIRSSLFIQKSAARGVVSLIH